MGEPKLTVPRLVGERLLPIGDVIREVVDRCAVQQREGPPGVKKVPSLVEAQGGAPCRHYPRHLRMLREGLPLVAARREGGRWVGVGGTRFPESPDIGDVGVKYDLT